MSTYGAPSGLTEQEKSLACYLAVQSLAQNRGISEEEASDLLDEAAGRGEMRLVGDEQG